MKTFIIQTENLGTVEIEADDSTDAINLFNQKYSSGDFTEPILDINLKTV